MDINTLVRKNIKNLTPYSSARDEFSHVNTDMVFIDANENPFQTSINRYPDPKQLKVKEALSKIKNISPNNMLLGNGSDEVIDLIFRVFCEPYKDNIVTLPPTYGMYKVSANINAIPIKEVLLTEDFQPDVDAIFSVIDQYTKLLFLCTPNNPSGNSFKAEIIEDILTGFKGIVVIDEAYIDFSESNSWLSRLEEFPNLIVTQTFSKALGMAGIRLGVCFASKEIIHILNTIKPPYNVNELTQQKALECIEKYGLVQQQVIDIKANRAWLLNQLKEISFIKRIYPTDANFVLVQVDHATKRYHQLIKQGIVVRNRTKQPLCENCLRVTIGTKEENLKLIKALKTI